VRAHSGRGIAGPRDVALIERCADDGVRSRAGARLAGVGLCARVAVAAGGAVGGVRVRADAGPGVADARDVALIERRADDGVRAGAGPRLARVGLCAGVAVAAGGAVRLDAVVVADARETGVLIRALRARIAAERP